MDIRQPEYSSCDIYYDADSKSLKNLKQEVIATFSDQGWVATVPTKTYSVQLQKAMKDYFNNLKEPDVAEVVTNLKKIFAKVKKQKIKDNEWLNGGCIALELNIKDVQEVQSLLAEWLTEASITFNKIENPHISTAYLQGYNKFSELSDVIKNLSNYTYNFSINKLEILHGATTNEEYVVLTLGAPSNFQKALKLIEQNSETIKFPGGFKSHCSLFCISQLELTEQKRLKFLEIVQSRQDQLFKKVKINPQAISLFNNSKLLELRNRLKQIIS